MRSYQRQSGRVETTVNRIGGNRCARGVHGLNALSAHVSRRGAAMVEFAIIAPVFLVLLLGTIESGNALEASNLLSSAIREGGRLGCMDWDGVVSSSESTNDKVIQDIRNFLSAAGMDADAIEITVTAADGDNAGQNFELSDPENRLQLFRITATIPFENVSTYPLHFMEGKDISMSIVFRAGNASLVN
ncbi:MAG: TadE family protein [Planctomycetaceae bacterium]